MEETPILRRLTRAEWKAFRQTGVLPFPKALAILVVPPLNADPVTKARPEPSESPMPPQEPEGQVPTRTEDESGDAKVREVKPIRPPPPLSELYPVTEEGKEAGDEGAGLFIGNILPRPRIPLYNGVTLFPSRPQRAALHVRLLSILGVERQAQRDAAAKYASAQRNHKRELGSEQEREEGEEKEGNHQEREEQRWQRGDDKKRSHAFLLCADGENVLRADAIPLAIALWRVRMWEGAGWDDTELTYGGWVFDRRGGRIKSAEPEHDKST